MRRALTIALLAAVAAGALAAAARSDGTASYRIEMYNAFGIVEGSDVRVAGVNVGSVTEITVNAEKRAVATVELDGELARLGDETRCESSPQSLIAEYFLDCDPAGEPLPEGGLVPASRVEMAIQPDIVANTMREPFRRRLTLLVNEFGTALAGNPEALNEAIELGAPALADFKRATRILAGQARLIRRMNVDSERVSRELAAYRDQIVEFVDEAEDVARTALTRREDVSRGFDLFDDYVAELGPTLAQLRRTADQQTPLLADLGAAAPDLRRLSERLPPFQRASERSLTSLGEAAVVGRRALRRGRDEIELLARAGRHAPATAEMVADLVRDLDDPRRVVEINDDAAATTGRTGEQPGGRDTKGYTGFEGLLNYPYYQALGINQFDSYGHALHINLFEVFSGPCGAFSSGRDPATGEPGIPAEGGGTTTEFDEIARCATWLGPNQPGINEDLGFPKYHPSVCPGGTHPEHARETLCDPDDPDDATRASRADRRRAPAGSGGATAPGSEPGAPGPRGEPGRGPPQADELRDRLEELLELPGGALDGIGPKGPGLGGGGGRGGGAGDILDFLLGP